MKRKSLIKIASLGFLCLIISFAACKKDRIVQDDYQNMDSFYNQHQEEEQVFVIDTPGTCPLIAKKGTKFCMTADMFMYPAGGGINYPFFLKVVELYSIKDMLLWRLPSIAGGTILETSAEIRARTFKVNDELVLNPGRGYYMEMDTMPILNNNMLGYYGYSSGIPTDWTNSISSITSGFVDSVTAVSVNQYYYSLTVAHMGWISAASPHTSSGQNTAITLTSLGTNTQNIEIFLSFTGFKGLMKISNLVSGSIPVGEQVTIVAFAKNQNNEFLLQQSTFTIVPNQQIALNMQVISEAGLLTALEGL